MSKFKQIATKVGKKIGIGLSPFEKLQRREKQEQDREDRYKRDLERSKREANVLAQQARVARLRGDIRVASQRGIPREPRGRSPEGFGGELFGFGYGRKESEDFGFGKPSRQQAKQRQAPKRRRKKSKQQRRKQPRQFQRREKSPFDFGF